LYYRNIVTTFFWQGCENRPTKVSTTLKKSGYAANLHFWQQNMPIPSQSTRKIQKMHHWWQKFLAHHYMITHEPGAHMGVVNLANAYRRKGA
jgi:hypothetical protein